MSKNDLVAIWEEHMRCEFELKDVDATMATMVKEPFVNHIPTMTGGIGYDQVYHFYKFHFIGKMPDDVIVRSVSRTVGENKLVDEIIVSFTHDREIDFMAPGIKPTGKFIELPHVAIIYFRDNKLHGEHIYWDQASLLVQLGLLDSNQFPVTGIEQTKKVLDENYPSNNMMEKFLKK